MALRPASLPVVYHSNRRSASERDGPVPNSAQRREFVKPAISGRISDKDRDRPLKYAGAYVYGIFASSACALENVKEYGKTFGKEEYHACGDVAGGQKSATRNSRMSSTTWVLPNRRASTWPYLGFSRMISPMRQPSYRSFSNRATNDNLKVSLRLKTTTVIKRNIRARLAVLSARDREKKGGRLRTKFIIFGVDKQKTRLEQRRVESVILPLWSIIEKWTSEFARINAYGARQAQAQLLSRRRQSPSLVGLGSKNSVAGPEGQPSSAGTWEKMSQDEKAQLWQPSLIHALESDPGTALVILDDNLVNDGRFFPAYVTKDSLEHLACVFLLDPDVDHPPESSTNTLHHMACSYLSAYGRLNDSASLSQRTIYLLSKYCNDDQFLTLIDFLQENKSHITPNSKLHIMERCTQLGRIGIALSLLGTIPVPNLAEAAVHSFCVSMLRADMVVDDLYGLRSNILTYMLKVGVRPNRQMANVIILNAMEGGDLKTAWRSHEIAVENGLPPNVYTYICLLKGVQHGDHGSNIGYVQECAAKDGTLATSLRLKFEILYATHVAKGHEPHWRPFLDLLRTYREFFDIKPLIDLGILDHWEGHQPAPTSPAPPVQALGLMILAWLREHPDHAKAQEVYEAYIRHVREGHPTIASLAKTDHTANAFIYAFGCHAKTLPLCTHVIQHMLKPGVADPSAEADASADSEDRNNLGSDPRWVEGSGNTKLTVRIAPPRIQTWNILLHSFIRNRQAAAAEKVLTIMQSRGHEPNQVTWNTLLGGYASMQDVIGVVGSLNRLEKAQLEADNWTMKALNRVVDRTALLDAYERSAEGRPVQVAEDDWWEDTEWLSIAENKGL